MRELGRAVERNNQLINTEIGRLGTINTETGQSGIIHPEIGRFGSNNTETGFRSINTETGRLGNNNTEMVWENSY